MAKIDPGADGAVSRKQGRAAATRRLARPSLQMTIAQPDDTSLSETKPGFGDCGTNPAIDGDAVAALRTILASMESMLFPIPNASGEAVPVVRAQSAQIIGMQGPIAGVSAGFGTWGLVGLAIDAARVAAANRMTGSER